MSTTSVYQRLVRAGRSGQSPADQASTARNGLLQVLAGVLQSSGDQVVNAKTVLPWLLASLGAPAALIGLLVPIRESGSMLPQAALAPRVRRLRRRRTVWVAGAGGQALATAAMALAAAVLDGVTAGVAILVALAGFAVSRSLCSLAGKDVLGRTVPKGERGQITGLNTALSGAVAITLGFGIRVLGGDGTSRVALALLLGMASLAWVVAAAVYATVREPDAATERMDDPAEGTGWAGAAWRLLRADATFRRFVVVRSLLLVSALSPPFVVALAVRAGDGGLGGLGPFVIAQGVAGLVGGRAFGRMADRSSRSLMVGGAAAASLTILVFLGLLAVPSVVGQWWLYSGTYLLLALTHLGVRVARKTYVVDLAEGDQRTEYVAVANTAMGLLLLLAGAISGGLAVLSTEAALGFLAALGIVGVLAGRRLPDVSRAS